MTVPSSEPRVSWGMRLALVGSCMVVYFVAFFVHWQLLDDMAGDPG